MNKQKSQSGFAHLAIIIILIVALLGTLGFVYWQNYMQPKNIDTSQKTPVENKDNNIITPVVADPIADWKTYTNAQYGFSFKYPVDWTVQESPTEKSNKIATPTPTIEVINPNSDDIRIFIYKPGIGGWGHEGNYGTISYDAKLETGQIALSGRDYYNGDGSRLPESYPNRDSAGYLIMFNFDNSGYHYTFYATGENVGNMDAADLDFKQIISTWKFN